MWMLLPLAALQGCAGDAPAARPASAPLAVSVSVPGWRVEPAAAVGPDAGSDAQLFNVVSVTEDPEGRFYAVNFSDKRVLVFDSTGRHLRTLGRAGRGPGEFRTPVRAAAVGSDGLYVVDILQRRISRFRRSDGRHLSDLAIRVSRTMNPRDMQATLNGSVAVEFRAPMTRRGGNTVRPRIMLIDTVSGSPVAQRTVELDTIPLVEARVRKGGRNLGMVMDLPFAPRPVWTLDPGGDVLFGTGAEFVLFRAAAAGVTPTLRGEGARQPVTRADQEDFFDFPDREPFRGQVTFPSEKPFYTGVMADGALVWLEVPSGQPGHRWEVREANGGRKVGELHLPENARLMHVAPRALYVMRTDQDDVETLHRLRLHR